MKRYFLLIICLFSLTYFAWAAPKSSATFTVVIDAGHGGKDPGALGTKINEKTLNLAVALALGKMIENDCPDVKVVYTRKTDVFLPLQERADIVNRNKADLFICIHTNSAEAKSVAGAEVFTLGLNKTQSNLDVAMRENAVMLLEDGYQKTYQGFNPNSVDSYIMFEFMQDQYVDKSLDYASRAQKELCSTAGRIDRNVRQAGFWVLHKSSCPSVLVEMGFITNAAEQDFLASTTGQNKIALALFNAFVDYKHEIEKKSGKPEEQTTNNQQQKQTKPAENKPAEKTQPAENKPAEKTKPAENKQAEKTKPAENKQAEKTKPAENKQAENKPAVKENLPIYKVQCFAVTQPLKAGDPTFKGEKNMSYYLENNWYKYTIGETNDYAEISKLQQNIKKKFPDCFIVAFVNGEKVKVEDARKMK